MSFFGIIQQPQGLSIIPKKGEAMAQSSIHIEEGHIGYFSHNSREDKTVNSIFHDEENYVSCNRAEAIKMYRSELKTRSEAYKKRTGQKLQKKSITHLSAIVNLNAHHTEDDLKKVCDYLEQTLDTKIIQSSIHRDEGHLNEDGENIKNLHAHLEFMGIDSEGKSIRRKLSKGILSMLQTNIAKILKMERGINYAKTKTPRPKRLNTYEFKKAKEMEAKAIEQMKRAKKELKEEVAKTRAMLQENKAVRADYARLEQMKKSLENKIENKYYDTEIKINYLDMQVDILNDVILKNALKDIPPFDKTIDENFIMPIRYSTCESEDNSDLYILRYTKGKGTTIMLDGEVIDIPSEDIFLNEDTNEYDTKEVHIRVDGKDEIKKFYFDAEYIKMTADEFSNEKPQTPVQKEAPKQEEEITSKSQYKRLKL